MIGFVLVGTNDLDRATQFYDKICAAFGAKRLYQMTTGCTGVMYGTGDGPTLGVVLPFDGKPAQAGNGVMIALSLGLPRGGRKGSRPRFVSGWSG